MKQHATDSEIRTAYDNVTLQLDVTLHELDLDHYRVQRATEALKILEKAFATLADPEKRKEYDQQIGRLSYHTPIIIWQPKPPIITPTINSNHYQQPVWHLGSTSFTEFCFIFSVMIVFLALINLTSPKAEYKLHPTE